MVKQIEINKVNAAIEKLEWLCTVIPPLLLVITEEEFSLRPFADKWSKKELVGHLIDSATNNHQRFVRVQFEESPAIAYDQNKWNLHNYYQALNSSNLVHLWLYYNLHLAGLLKNVPENKLSKLCTVGEKQVTLGFLITDYVAHLEHHLAQLVHYDSIKV